MQPRCLKVRSSGQLKELQRLMARAIMRPLTPADGMQRRWQDGGSTGRVAASFIKPNDRLTSFERLEIYNRQYWFRLLDGFHDDFPGLRAVVGDRKFMKLAEAYIERYPSRSFTLRNLGNRLGQFLREEPHWTAPHGRLAADVARFEWAQVLAFDGEARPILAMNSARGVDPSKLKLDLQPYVSLLELEFPVDDFIIAVKKDAALRSEASNAMKAKRATARSRKLKLPCPRKIRVAVHRMDHALFYKHLEPEAYRLLTALRKGRTIGDACAHALRSSRPDAPEWADRIREWFQNWTALGWFCARE